MKKIRRFYHMLGASKILELVSLILTVAFIPISYFSESTLFLCLATISSIVSLTLLIYALSSSHNKQRTLLGLIEDSRINSVRLLLMYDCLRFPLRNNAEFTCSPLIARTASFTYEMTPSDTSYNHHDLRCRLHYLLKAQSTEADFDVLVLQPRGENSPEYKYCFEGDNPTPVWMEPIKFEESREFGFSGLLKGTIHAPVDAKELVVDFTLKNVHLDGKNNAIIICPFFYVKQLESFNVKFIYKNSKLSYLPSAITLSRAPYDGSKGGVYDILNLTCNHEKMEWTGEITKNKCSALSLYVASIHSKRTNSLTEPT